MPKGTKPPPPQQSNLEEMWGKKKKRPAAESVQEEGKNVTNGLPGMSLSEVSWYHEQTLG